MAGRPPKERLDFSGWDVDIFDNDPKIDKLMDSQGCAGFVIYFYLCQKAYGSNGYYYSWCYDDSCTTARKIGGGVGAKSVEETVRYCLQIGLFDKGLFDRWKILTSRGIQKRYRQVAIARTGNTVVEEYWLLKKEESTGLNICAQKSNFDPPKLNYDTPKLNYAPHKVKYSKKKYSKVIVKSSKVNKTPPLDFVQNADEPSPTVTDTITITTPKQIITFTKKQIDELEKAYPNVDIIKDIEKMQLDINNMPKCNLSGQSLSDYITRWFRRTQDSGGNRNNGGGGKKSAMAENIKKVMAKSMGMTYEEYCKKQ